MYFSGMPPNEATDKIGMGHIYWSCCLNATSLSPLATAKALGLDIPPTTTKRHGVPQAEVQSPITLQKAVRHIAPPRKPARARRCGISSQPMPQMGHFGPIRPVLPAGSRPLRPESGPEAGRDRQKAH